MKTIKKRTEPKKVSAFACGVCDGILHGSPEGRRVLHLLGLR